MRCCFLPELWLCVWFSDLSHTSPHLEYEPAKTSPCPLTLGSRPILGMGGNLPVSPDSCPKQLPFLPWSTSLHESTSSLPGPLCLVAAESV